MQLTDIFCYFVFTITIATSFAQADDHRHELSEAKSDKRISKRDAAIFIDSFPIEPIYSHRPKIIYRRISTQRYKSSKPKYGPPMYRSKPRKPIKKYKNVKPRYGPPSYKRRPTKPKYGPPKQKYKPVYGPPKNVPQSYYAQEPTSFGEPPADVALEYPSKQNFGEPPLDSYGSPINADVLNPYIPDQFSPSSYSDPSAIENLDPKLGQDWQNFQDQNYDNNVAYSKIEPTYLKPDVDIIYSKKRPTFTKPYYSDDMKYSKRRPTFTKSNPFGMDNVAYTKKRFTVGKPEHFDSDHITNTKRPIFVTPETDEADEDFDSSSDMHISKNSENFDDKLKIKRRPQYSGETIKMKTIKPQPTTEPDDDVLVGGRYAEPPARFVPKYQQTFSLHSEDNDFAPLKGFVDPDIAISATISPYVNYKYSNVAFSPQNLNDAFSIVDKK